MDHWKIGSKQIGLDLQLYMMLYIMHSLRYAEMNADFALQKLFICFANTSPEESQFLFPFSLPPIIVRYFTPLPVHN